MRTAILALALLFCLFPYTQIIPLESYTQPYALLFCTLVVAISVSQLQASFPRSDAIALFGLALVGVIGFLISCMPNPNSQEFKYLLIYLSPPIFTWASYAVVMDNPKTADRLVAFGALVWIGVGAIQAAISPSFMTQFVGSFGDSAGVVVDSGRGTLGLAPEPTHFGFHMIVLAAALAIIGGRNMLSLACLATSLLVARSSSALLAIVVGGILYIAVYTRRARILLVAALPAYFLLGALLQADVLPQGVRVVSLLRDFYADPFYALTSDASANARLGGIYVGAKQIWQNMFLPAGLSQATWLQLLGILLARNSWLMFLSDSGIPSGILIVVFQTGIIGALLLGYMIRRIGSDLRSHYEAFLISALFVVFVSQYMISTPGFGIIYGFCLARRDLLARRAAIHAVHGVGQATPMLAAA